MTWTTMPTMTMTGLVIFKPKFKIY